MSDRACKDADRLYNSLCQSPIIKVVQNDENASHTLYRNQTEQFHINVNGGWAKPILSINTKKYELSKLPKFYEPIDAPLESDPTDTPENNSSQKIDESKVREFLDIQHTPKIEGVRKFSEVTKPSTINPFNISLPSHATDIKCLITIKLNSFEISNLLPTDQMSGFIQIYDFNEYSPLSEPIYFSFSNKGVKFIQTDQDLVYYPIRNINLNLTIVCFIMKKSENSPVPKLFACNRTTLFDQDKNLVSNIEFSQDWYPISNNKDIQSMFTFKIDETQEATPIQIKSSMEVKQITDSKTIHSMKFTYSWKGRPDLDFSALPLYPLADCPTPVCSIFNLHFVLNKPPPNSELYVKAILVNEEGELNMINLEKTARRLFYFPGENSQNKETFYSSSVTASNEFSLPDCIRVYVGAELTDKTLLVLFVMAKETNKKGKTKEYIYKVGVIQLQNEDNDLQATQRIPLFEMKKFPKKYLSQQKKQNKTYLQFTMSLHPAFFPTPFCKQLFKATESTIPDFPADCQIHLSSAIIPIIAKLLSLHSEKMLDKLFTLLEMLRSSSSSALQSSTNLLSKKDRKDSKKGKDKKDKNLSLTPTSSVNLVFNGNIDNIRYHEVLSYWIYNNFDASTCQPDFFCQILRNYIQNSVRRMASIRDKCDDAKAVIHGSNSDTFDLSTLKLKPSSSNFGDSKKDTKKETKKEKKNTLLMQTEIYNDLKETKEQLILIKNNIEIVLDIVCASIARYIKQNKQELSDNYTPSSQPIVSFFKEFSSFLIELDWIEVPQVIILSIAKKFTQVLYIVQTFFTNRELCDIIHGNFYDLSSYVDATNKTKTIALKIELYLMQGMFYKPNLIIAAASLTKELQLPNPFSPFNKVFSQIFLMANTIFQHKIGEIETQEILSLFCGSLSIVTSQMETIYDNSVLGHICYFLLPFISNISSYYDQLSIYKNLQDSITPFILLVLNNCNTKYLYQFYHNMLTINKTNFITFLKSITNVAIKKETSGKYPYIKQITQRILNILLTIVEELEKPMEQVVDLMDLLLFKNEYQTSVNYPHFYNFISQLISNQKCDRRLILLLLDNINAKYHSLRCLCASLLNCQIYADYVRNEDIVYSSIDILDSLTAILLQLKPEELVIYKDLIELLSDLAPTYKDGQFTKLVTESMKTASVIVDVVEEQKNSKYPPEVQCRQTMKIADQYRLMPSMRMKWLQQVLNINVQNGNYVSAFITQMHIVALMATIYDFKRKVELKKAGMNIILNQSENDELLPDPPFHLMIVQPIENAYPKTAYTHTQPYLDFAFLPEVAEETDMKFEEFTAGTWGLIEEFNFDTLQDEINKAFELGMKAELYYSLRPLLSLLMRIFYIGRNFDGMSKASDLLQKALYQVTFESCTLSHDVNLQFYLVEMKGDDGNEINRQVYCVKLGDLKERAEIKSTNGQQSSPPETKEHQHSDGEEEEEEEEEGSKDDDNDNVNNNNNNDANFDDLDKRFIKLIYSKERFGNKKLKICNHHDPDRCFKDDPNKVCIVRLEPTDNIPVDYEDPHCWNKFQTRITRKLISEDSDNDKVQLVSLETKDPAPHYKMTIDVTEFNIVEKTKAEIVNDVALSSAAALDVISENLESYFEYENAETWNISPDESYNYEFVDKLHILQSFLGMKEKKNESGEIDDNDSSILGLLTVLKVKYLEDAKRIVREIIQPSLKRALMIFLRGKKELTSMEKYISDVDKTLEVANEFLKSFSAEMVKKDELYMSTTNSVWQKFKFEKEINY